MSQLPASILLVPLLELLNSYWTVAQRDLLEQLHAFRLLENAHAELFCLVPAPVDNILLEEFEEALLLCEAEPPLASLLDGLLQCVVEGAETLRDLVVAVALRCERANVHFRLLVRLLLLGAAEEGEHFAPVSLRTIGCHVSIG